MTGIWETIVEILRTKRESKVRVQEVMRQTQAALDLADYNDRQTAAVRTDTEKIRAGTEKLFNDAVQSGLPITPTWVAERFGVHPTRESPSRPSAPN